MTVWVSGMGYLCCMFTGPSQKGEQAIHTRFAVSLLVQALLGKPTRGILSLESD